MVTDLQKVLERVLVILSEREEIWVFRASRSFAEFILSLNDGGSGSSFAQDEQARSKGFRMTDEDFWGDIIGEPKMIAQSRVSVCDYE